MMNEIKVAAFSGVLLTATGWPLHASASDGATQSAPSATAPSTGAARASGGVSNGLGNAKDNQAMQRNVGKEGASTGRQSTGGIKQAPASAPQSRQTEQTETEVMMNASDQASLRDLSQAHLFETKLAGLAAALSGNALVRGYAVKMLEDHLKSLDSLRGMAAHSGVTLPGGVESGQAVILHALSLKSGADFDKAYLDAAGPVLQQQEIAQLQAVSRSARSEDLKRYVLEQAQLTTRHLKLADNITASPQVAANALAAASTAGQSVSSAAPADTASNRKDGNGGNPGAASIAGSTVHPKK